jgi:RNA polymerase sigma-70 factor, ECF subfamily
VTPVQPEARLGPAPTGPSDMSLLARQRSAAARPATPGEGASDEALCEALRAGDAEALGVLVRRHQALVLRLVRRFTDRPEDAADLAQAAFLRALEASRRGLLARWRPGQPAPFRAWVVRIALNLAKNHARQRRRWARAPEEALAGLAAAGDGAHETLERAQSLSAVRAQVLGLPRRQREVLLLRVDGGLPFKDVAEALGITENNAKVQFHHAVRRLRELVPQGAPAAPPDASR